MGQTTNTESIGFWVNGRKSGVNGRLEVLYGWTPQTVLPVAPSIGPLGDAVWVDYVPPKGES